MTLLVALDESPIATRVLEHAVDFARGAHQELHVIRVMDPKLDVVQGPDNPDAVVAAARASWEEALFGQLTAAGGHGSVSVPVLEGKEPVHGAIARIASELNAHAIAMGSQGAGLLRHAILGSVAMGVVKNAPCPVMIVGPSGDPADTDDDAYTILVTAEEGADAAAVLDAMQPLLQEPWLNLVLLHLYESRLGDDGETAELERAQQALEAERAKLPHPEQVTAVARTLPQFERVDAGVLRIAEEFDVDAIAMATKGYSTRRHILAGSVAVGILKRSPVPVFLMRRP